LPISNSFAIKVIQTVNGRVIEDHGDTIRIFVPMELRKRSGRKVIIEPDAPHDDNEPSPLVVALARAYVWQLAIDSGEFQSAQELAKHFRVDASLVRRILRLGGISPRIVEAALEGREPDVSLNALLDMDVPVTWGEQEELLRSDEASG
jgi:hypothetical protein